MQSQEARGLGNTFRQKIDIQVRGIRCENCRRRQIVTKGCKDSLFDSEILEHGFDGDVSRPEIFEPHHHVRQTADTVSLFLGQDPLLCALFDQPRESPPGICCPLGIHLDQGHRD